MLPARARVQGSLGFNPGDWWVNSTFAFRDGIIDSGDAADSITCDKYRAYAILLTDDAEMSCSTPEKFIFRAGLHDKGRYRLTSATRDGRGVVRVLRSHRLRSFWSPRAGVRYDGLYRVTGWSVHTDRKAVGVNYDIAFERLASEPPMTAVLCRPNTAEIEDYVKFNRLCQKAKLQAHQMPMSIPIPRLTFLVSTDGMSEEPSSDQHANPELTLEAWQLCIDTPVTEHSPTMSAAAVNGHAAD